VVYSIKVQGYFFFWSAYFFYLIWILGPSLSFTALCFASWLFYPFIILYFILSFSHFFIWSNICECKSKLSTYSSIIKKRVHSIIYTWTWIACIQITMQSCSYYLQAFRFKFWWSSFENEWLRLNSNQKVTAGNPFPYIIIDFRYLISSSETEKSIMSNTLLRFSYPYLGHLSF
jgi:hypothetical protein